MNGFEYNGVSSLSMGIKIISKDIYSAPKYDLKFQSIPGRDGELILPNGRFPNSSVSYSCFLPAKSIEELTEKITAVKAWLYTEPDRYHTLSDTYDVQFFRYAVFNNKLDIVDQCKRIGVFTINFSCKPYRYLLLGQIKTTYTESGFVLTNPYPFATKPYIKINGRGSGRLVIQSAQHNDIWSFSTLNGYTECDSELMNFYHDTEPKNDTVEGDGFPLLHPGENAITFDGGIESVEIKPRWQTI
ncbi:MAG: phage tail family protein [Clostridia bacterium]|nr:phage tail family protein [Clostridia bacterium]